MILSALHPCLAQNNKYKINDSCYPIYRTADSLMGTVDAEKYIKLLKEQAEKVQDDKALTLAAVLELRQATRIGHETEVLVRYGELKETARIPPVLFLRIPACIGVLHQPGKQD